jgi:predicted nuclease with RNAse H fold
VVSCLRFSLVEPAVLQLFQEKGIDVKEIYPRAKVKRQGIAMEIDILAVDDNDLVLVERNRPLCLQKRAICD